MADYYPLIAKAVEGLEKSTSEARRGLYDRARKALVTQLRGVEPALSESDITRERLALEEAIRKVEAEAARRSRRDSPPPARPEPPPPDARPPQTTGPETPQSETTVGLEPAEPEPNPESEPRPEQRPEPAPQADIAEPVDAAEADDPSAPSAASAASTTPAASVPTAPIAAPAAERQSAPALSAAAVNPALPLVEGIEDVATANTPDPVSASDAGPAPAPRPRLTAGGGPSLSDRALKGFRDGLADARTRNDGPTQTETTRDQAAPNPASSKLEPRMQQFERRPDPRVQARTAMPGDRQTDTRTDARARPRPAKPPIGPPDEAFDTRTRKPPDRRPDKPADKPIYISAEPRTDRIDRRTGGRIDAGDARRGEPRGDLRSQPRSEPRADLRPQRSGEPHADLSAQPRGEPRAAPRPPLPRDMSAEPRVEPGAPLRPSPRDAEKFLGREPVTETGGGVALGEAKRMRTAQRPQRPPEPPPLDEPEAGDEEFEPAAQSEYSTRPPSSMALQEDMRRRTAAAPPDAVSSERAPAAPWHMFTLTREKKKLVALAIMALLPVTFAAVGLWKQPGLRGWMRNLPNFSRTADNPAPGDSTGRTKITDRIGAAPIVPQSANDGAVAPQKVVLIEEDPNDANGKPFTGTVVWRNDRVAPSPGKPPELAIRADIEIPEQRMSLRWSLRRNDDKALPASHTVEIMFTLPPGFAHGGISDIPGVLAKQGESTRGIPLAGLRVKVTDNYFLIGLSLVEADMQRNIALLKERSWFDIPVVYADGKRAILAIEKGPSGERVFSEAFAAWGQ